MSADRSFPPQRLPCHDPRILQESVRKAEEFYKWDKQLTQADRRKLSSYFWQKLAIFPILGLPVMYGFIVSPNYLKKRGILDPKKRYRMLQFGLGFFGLGVGFQVSNAVSSMIHMQLLNNNPPARNVYDTLRRYPPQLGSRYFSMTAKSPELAMKNPEKIDWKSNPLFPIILVMNQEIVQQVRKIDTERHEKYRTMRENRVQKEIEHRSHRSETGSNEDSLTGTSWDNVIAQNKSNDPLQGESSYGGYGSTPYQSTPYQSTSYQSTPYQSTPYQDDELSKEQRRFDEMLERERQDAMQDDFSDSDDRWK